MMMMIQKQVQIVLPGISCHVNGQANVFCLVSFGSSHVEFRRLHIRAI
jgi:hypothetical protein